MRRERRLRGVAPLIGNVGGTARSIASKRLAPPLYRHGDRLSRRLALTFDDGPADMTPRVLDLLADRGVRATFFVVGGSIPGRTDVLRRIVREGHEVGNHTLTHTRLARRWLRPHREIWATNRRVRHVTGVRPRVFRAPWGELSRRLGWAAPLAGLRIVHWDVDSGDWEDPAPEMIVRRVLDSARGGSVVLLHDGAHRREATVAALPQLVDGLIARGYDLVTVSELLR